MIRSLDEAFRFHEQALALRAKRQQIIASNIANADTPQYKARDLDFAQALAGAVGGRDAGAQVLARTAVSHLAGSQAAAGGAMLYRTPLAPSVDGNTVELDLERAQFADNAVRFEAGLAFLNHQIKALLSAIQG